MNTTGSIDQTLAESFQTDRVIQAFYDLKLAKWDRFSEWDDPTIKLAMGADGVDFKSFEKQLMRHAKNICRRIQGNSYIFYPFRELDILKQLAQDGKPAKFRTLSIASLRDSIVQQILYEDVLYTPFEALFATLDHPAPISFAYRKGKSAPKAALAAKNYIDEGYQYIFDADLSKYFDTIPHDELLSKVEQIIDQSNSTSLNLIRRFIHTDRVLFSSYKYASSRNKKIGHKVFHWKKPRRTTRDAGVPQGGVLSGMLANLYLHDFDDWVVNVLGNQIDLRYVRYADDFIILLRSADLLDKVHQEVKNQISMHKLDLNDDKTLKLNAIDKGLDFVGFHLAGHTLSVKLQGIERFKKALLEVFDNPPQKVIQKNDPNLTLKWLVRRIKYKIQGYSGQNVCPKCGLNRFTTPRSWMAFFQVVTDTNQLKNLDKWIRQSTYEYIYKNHRVRITRNRLRQLGLRTLVNEKFRIPSLRVSPCLCDLDQKGLWYFAEDLYLHKRFKTLARGSQFYVERVDNTGIKVQINKKSSLIPRKDIEDTWETIKTQGNISRTDMEHKGIKNTSQIVALLSELSAIKVSLQPIRLYFDGYHPAEFLTHHKLWPRVTAP
jgi:RNA-directed DNA polymerase